MIATRSSIITVVRAGVILLAVAACSFERAIPSDGDAGVVIPDAPPGAWLTGYPYRKAVAVTRGPGTTTLAEFPVGIVLASDPDLAARARADGRDIVVTSGDAMTRLEHELVAFSASDGALELWARVPALPPATTTVLYLYYGGAPTAPSAAAVWPAATFKGVWHLSGAAADAADSTAGGHTLTAAATPAVPAHVAGLAGSARSYDGVDDALAIADPGDGSLDVGTRSFAYTLWLRSAGTVGMFDNPFFRGGTSPGSPGFCLLTGSDDPWLGKLHDGTTYTELALVPPVTNTWLHVAVVVDRDSTPARASAYVDGVQTAQQALALGSLDTQRELSLGAGTVPFRGALDEVRLYNTAPSAEWIATEHANLATPGFLVRGDEEREP